MLIEKKMTEENKSKKRPVRFPDTMYKPPVSAKAKKAYMEDTCLKCGRDFLDYMEDGCTRVGCDNYTG